MRAAARARAASSVTSSASWSSANHLSDQLKKPFKHLDEFLVRLQTYKNQMGPDARVLINGDEAAFFSQARYVIDEVRKSGITKVLIETRTKPL